MKDKVALVTGAASGLGRAAASCLSAEGARVACVDTNAGGIDETAQAIVAAGGEAIAIAANVTDASACASMVADVVRRFGSLTTLVNSAGVRSERPGATPAFADWQRVVDVNLTGTYLASQAAMETLIDSGNGSITNLASIYGLVGGATGPAYAASKGAIVNLTRQMALEWAPLVRVNCVCPGVIETPMTAPLRKDTDWSAQVLKRYPLGRFGKPDEVAAAILFLASDEAAYVTGVALPVDGGYTAA